jgi:TolB protein
MPAARRIGTATAALTVLLFPAACAGRPDASGSATPPVPVVATSASPGVSATPVEGSVAGLPGWLYYWADPDRVLRLTRSAPVTVLQSGGQTANVSPDGRSVAYLDDSGNVVVADRDGGNPRTVMKGSAGAGYEPAWSPDSTRVLVARVGIAAMVPGVVTVATGTFTALAHNPNGIHYLWSADGRHLGYATGTCQLGEADADGGNAHLVPVLGSEDKATNPDRKRSCDPFSIAPDGSKMAVDLHTGDQEDGDIGRNLRANAVIDMRTGAVVPLAVPGQVSAVLFQPDGGMLVRSGPSGHGTLTLLKPDGTVGVQVAEPAVAADFALLAYTSA